jgi:Restriction endonuclease
MKPSVTRTFGPIHFDDLDPHRFEDLVRELIYDFKDWHSIEATGRSGQDEGFDVRAFERAMTTTVVDGEDAEIEEAVKEGNLWMIQAKREKTLRPARVRSILTDINQNEPPYGYILAVAADISKKTYDTFRDELRRKGVKEFHLWSKAELEDMLYQPKNDRVLFTFFGISLVTRRRSRGTEVRQVVTTKNKIHRILGENPHGGRSILIRDIEDAAYPYRDKVPAFASRPPWREYVVDSQHPRGIIVNLLETFGWLDVEGREFDHAEGVNLVRTKSENEKHDPKSFNDRRRTQGQWEHLPSHLQAMFHRNGLVRYSDIVIVDDKGDSFYEMPHLYVVADPKRGLVPQSFDFMTLGDSFIPLDGFQRVHKWPKTHMEKVTVKVEGDSGSTLPEVVLSELRNNREGVCMFYDIAGDYEGLKPFDALRVPKQSTQDSSQYYLEVTHIEKVTVGELVRRSREHSWHLERLFGRAPDAGEVVTLIEGRRRYDFDIERDSDSVI